MKKLFITFGLIVLLASPVFGDEVFTPATPDNTVGTIDEVKVKGTVTNQVDTVREYSLPHIDDEIFRAEQAIAKIEAEIVVLQALRAKVLAEAEKVVSVPIADPEPIE